MTILSSLFLNERVLSISLTARDGGTKPDERWKIRLELKTHFSYSSDQACGVYSQQCDKYLENAITSLLT